MDVKRKAKMDILKQLMKEMGQSMNERLPKKGVTVVEIASVKPKEEDDKEEKMEDEEEGEVNLEEFLKTCPKKVKEALLAKMKE